MKKLDYAEQPKRKKQSFLRKGYGFLFSKQESGESIFEAVMAGLMSIGLLIVVLVMLMAVGA